MPREYIQKKDDEISNFFKIGTDSEYIDFIALLNARNQAIDRERGAQKRITFEDVVGQDEAVRECRQFVASISHADVLRKRGIQPSKGLLLHGPPGTGKTLLARAIAEQAHAEFLQIGMDDVSTLGLQGVAEMRIKSIFEKIKSLTQSGKKVILFVDEMEQIFPQRNNDKTSSSNATTVVMFLQYLSGMKENPNVFVVGATNFPESVDKAIKRSGRFDKKIFVDLPTEAGRLDLLRHYMHQLIQNAADKQNMFAEDINLSQIAEITHGFSGADIASLINDVASEKAILEIQGTPWTPISTDDLASKIPQVKKAAEETRRIGF